MRLIKSFEGQPLTLYYELDKLEMELRNFKN